MIKIEYETAPTGEISKMEELFIDETDISLVVPLDNGCRLCFKSSNNHYNSSVPYSKMVNLLQGNYPV